MSTVKDADLSLWLHNKLGQLDEHWSAKIVSPHLDRHTINNASEIFNNFQPHVKMKFLLSLLHISKRNLEEWKNDINNLIDIADASSDQWCSALAKILRSYISGDIAFDQCISHTYFPDLINRINNIIDDKAINHNISSSLLPLESLFLNKNAMNSITSFQPIQTKYFALKRKPKSAILRAEMLQKALDVNSQSKSKNPMGALIPIKAKNIKQEVFETDYKEIKNPPNALKINRPLKKELGKIKLLEISEQPHAGKDMKKKKKMDDIYLNTQSFQQDNQTSIMNYPFQDMHSINKSQIDVLKNFAYNSDQPASSSWIDTNDSNSHLFNYMENTQLDIQPTDQISLTAVLNNPNLLKLTNEQVLQAQEIFGEANVVTIPEKTLILAFMSGIRENPWPNQGNILSIKLSELMEEVTISANNPSDNPNEISNEGEGTSDPTLKQVTLVAQIFFQMNYETGEWKRIKTYRTPSTGDIN